MAQITEIKKELEYLKTILEVMKLKKEKEELEKEKEQLNKVIINKASVIRRQLTDNEELEKENEELKNDRSWFINHPLIDGSKIEAEWYKKKGMVSDDEFVFGL